MSKQAVVFLVLIISIVSIAAGGVVCYFFGDKIFGKSNSPKDPEPTPTPTTSTIVETINGGLTFVTDGEAALDVSVNFEGIEDTSHGLVFNLNKQNKTEIYNNIDISMVDVNSPVVVTIVLEHAYQSRSLDVQFAMFGELQNSTNSVTINGETPISNSHVMGSVSTGGNVATYVFTIASQDMTNLVSGAASIAFEINLIPEVMTGNLLFETEDELEIDIDVNIEGVNTDVYIPTFSLDSSTTSRALEDVDITMIDANTPVVVDINISHQYLYESMHVQLYPTEELNNDDIKMYVDGNLTDNVEFDMTEGTTSTNIRFIVSSLDEVSLVTGGTSVEFYFSLNKPELVYSLCANGLGVYEQIRELPVAMAYTTNFDYNMPSSLTILSPTTVNKNETYTPEEAQAFLAAYEELGANMLVIMQAEAFGLANIPYLLLLQLQDGYQETVYKNQIQIDVNDPDEVLDTMNYLMLYASLLYRDEAVSMRLGSNTFIKILGAYCIGIIQELMKAGFSYEFVQQTSPDLAEYLDKIGGLPEENTSSEELFYALMCIDVNFVQLVVNGLNSILENGLFEIPSSFVLKEFRCVVGNEYKLSFFNTLMPSVNIMSSMIVNNFKIGSDVDFVIDKMPNIIAKRYVVENNANYKTISGELLSADGKILIAYNNGSSATEYVVPSTVTSISNYLFAPNVYTEESQNNLTKITINMDQFDLIPEIQLGSLETIVNTDHYVSRYQLAEWESMQIQRLKIVYTDDKSGFSYVYEEDRNGYMVQSFVSSQSFVNIPETFAPEGGEEANVVGIKSEAFINSPNLQYIGIPKTLHFIEDRAFEGLDNMSEIDFGYAVIAECGANIFGNRTDVLVYSQIESTARIIKNTANAATSIKMAFLIETAKSSTNYQMADQKGTLKVLFSLGSQTFALETEYYNGLSKLFNGYVVMFEDDIAELDVSVQVDLDADALDLSSTQPGNIDHIQEQIGIGRIESDGSITLITGTAKDVGYFNHSTPQVSVSYAGKANTGDELQLTVNFVVMTYVQCFTEGTLVTLADGSTKAIEDVTYDDLLLVYDFDRGEFSYSYPIWITQSGTYDNYYLMKFDDGSELEIVLSHRLFNTQGLSFEKSIDALYTQIGQPFFKQTLDAEGNPIITTPICISIEKINKTCKYYNMVTSQALNFFANGFLGSTGISNIYTFEKTADGRYIHNQDQLADTRGTNDTAGDMFSYEQFDTSKITYEMYIAYRLGEAKNMADILANTAPYNQYPIETVYQIAIKTINDYFAEDYAETMLALPDTFKVTTSDGDSTRVAHCATYALTVPSDTKGFVGWYNSFDGKIYQAGDIVTIYRNTHFIARYN